MSFRDIFPDLVIECIMKYYVPYIMYKDWRINLCLYCKRLREKTLICDKCKYYMCSTCYQTNGSVNCLFCGTDTTVIHEKKRIYMLFDEGL